MGRALAAAGRVEAAAPGCRSWPGTRSARPRVPGRLRGPWRHRRLTGAAAARRRRRRRAARRAGHAPVPAAAGRPRVAAARRGRAGRHRLRLGRARAGSGCRSAAHDPGLEDLYAAAGVARGSWSDPRALRGDTAADARSATATSSRSAATSMSPTASGLRGGLPGRPGTATSTPSTTPRGSAGPGDRPDGRRRRRSRTTRTGPRRPSTPDADDFVDTVRARLRGARRARTGGRGSSWSRTTPSCSGTGGTRGPSSSRPCCARCPAPGVRVTTLSGAIDAGHVAGGGTPGPVSWGSGKDWRVWEGPACRTWCWRRKACSTGCCPRVDAHRGPARDPRPRPARARRDAGPGQRLGVHGQPRHRGRVRARAGGDARGPGARAGRPARRRRPGRRGPALADRLRALDGPFGHLDARVFSKIPPPP